MYSDNVLHGVGVEAINFVRDNLALILRYAALLAGVETALWIAIPPAGDLVVTGLSVFLGAAFAVTLHRRILSDETGFPPEADARLLLFIAAIIAQSIVIIFLGASVTAVVMVSAAAVSSPGLASLIALIAGMLVLPALLWFAARTILFFPHIAVTLARSVRLSGVWEMSRGLVLPIILRLMVFVVATIGLYAVLALFLPDGVEPLPLLGRIATSPAYFVQSLAAYLISACFVALASLIYRRAVSDLQVQALPADDA